jgi:hypothetical protein
MPWLTTDQVKNLAPDPASLKAGQGLVEARHWASLGGSDAALWGECMGSGKEPYKVRVDLSNIGYACTCPSRKAPCKHVLALMLLAAISPAKLQQSAPPGWATEWLEKRAAHVQADTKRAEPKANPESRQKEAARRTAKREKLAETGIDTLEHWLKDFARLGLASAQSAPASFWEGQTARMVDCQLPGAARMVREMAALPESRPDWAEILLLRLGRLYLLVQAYRKLDTLPEAAQQDVRALLGWNVDQDDLAATIPGTRDDWLVLASRTDEDEKTGLRTQTNWLWGKASQRLAQILNYAYRAQPLDANLVPGLVLRGELVFFPGAYPLRAICKEKQVSGQGFVPSGFVTLAGFLHKYAAALGKNPWLETFPVVLENIVPQRIEPNWMIRDGQNLAFPLSAGFTSPWELLALSGGHPLTVFGLWDGFSFTPMAAWIGERYVNLHSIPQFVS